MSFHTDSVSAGLVPPNSGLGKRRDRVATAPGTDFIPQLCKISTKHERVRWKNVKLDGRFLAQ
jgi:hypothetical protein